MQELTDRDKAIVDFAARWYRYAGAQEQAMIDELDINATRFWQVMNVLIDRPAAMAYDPMTVRRYQRLRANRSHRTRG